ncbi:Uncharacterised protein [Mycobacteroides abscessus subsp. abscessus]|nr:Uncharacterised protein [Mycobacteroides abscessus subsp. abscessus]
MAIDPAARPSRPSVKLTAFDHAATISQQNTTNATETIEIASMSRT